MATMFDVSQQELVERTAEELKKVKEIQPTSWAPFVKTGTHKEMMPSQEDWWYMRAASILRVIALRGPVGVSKLRTRYGGKKNRGVRPEKFKVASGNIIRKILQQLDAAGFSKQAKIGVHKGRVITPAGQKFIDKCATEIAKEKPKEEKVEQKPVEKPKEEKTEQKPVEKPEEKKVEQKPVEEAAPKKNE